MQTITKYLALIVLCLSVQFINAQESRYLIKMINGNLVQYAPKFTLPDEKLKSEIDDLNNKLREIHGKLENGQITKKEAKELSEEAIRVSKEVIEDLSSKQYVRESREDLIEKLKEQKEYLSSLEKQKLKKEVEQINEQVEKGKISVADSDSLKLETAKRYALNIENIVAIRDNKIALLERGENIYFEDLKEHKSFWERSKNALNINSSNSKLKYDKRTTSDFVLGFGLNNAIIEGENLDSSPYKFAGSRFLEIGWAWKTRVFKNSNFLRFKYGYSFQINGLKPTDNKYFVKQGDQTVLEEFPENLKKSKLSITNLVFPVHFEIGPSKKIDKDTYFRYSTDRQFKLGLGGYAGFNIGTRQKLKYTLNGERIKDKQKRGLNTTDLVYGLSGYVAFGSTALYVKYDLSPIFKDQLVDQNNVSIGVRFDMD